MPDPAPPTPLVWADTKRRYVAAQFAPRTEAIGSWRLPLPPSRRAGRQQAAAQVVRVRCGARLHRLRLVERGSAVLLDHPRLDARAEQVLVALGASRPDCLLVLDAIAGRVSVRRIQWRRRAYQFASTAHDRARWRAWRTSTDPLQQPLLERYAGFVRARAMAWLAKIVPERTRFDVLVVPPPGVLRRPHSVWSWRDRAGVTDPRRGCLTVHIPIDWCLTVERPHLDESPTAFFVEARTDRRGTLVKRLNRVQLQHQYHQTDECKTSLQALDPHTPAYPRRWQRAWKPSRITPAQSTAS